MIDHESRIGEEFERAVNRAQRWTPECWVMIVCTVYLAARVIPWALAGFAVVAR